MRPAIKDLLKDHLAKGSISDLPLKLLAEIAQLRYQDDEALGKKEIPLAQVRAELGLTHDMQVSRLLAEARRRGIISIRIKDPAEVDQESVEKKVRARFPHLRLIEVVAAPGNDHEPLMEVLGKRAAEVFDRLYAERGRMTISLGGGDTISHLVNALPSIPRRIRVAPLALLARSAVENVYDSPYLAMLAHWKSLPLSSAYICSVPPLPKPSGTSATNADLAKYCRRFYMENPSVREVMERSFESDLAFVGVSDLHEKSRIVENAYELVGYGFDPLYAMGGRVDLNYAVLDSRGKDLSQQIAKELRVAPIVKGCHPFLLAVGMERLRELSLDRARPRDVILVAGAQHKHRCIRAALLGKIVNGLITDDRTLARLADDDFMREIEPIEVASS